MDDALVRTVGDDGRQNPLYNLTDSPDVFSLKTFDPDDALVRAPGVTKVGIPYNLQRLATRKEGSPPLFDTLS
jgi:hypothetical protein